MIDMHCHLLYGVDDGPGTMEEAVAMLKEAAKQGIHAIILTPHWRHGMFPYPKDAIEAHYEIVHKYARELGIAVYLGTEYHVDSQMMENFSKGSCHSLADTRYILTEYSHDTRPEMAKQMTAEAVRYGYIPVIAHAERYGFVMEEPDILEELRDMGALIQINADAVLGLDGRSAKKLCKWILKEDLADLIASDSHGVDKRPCNLKKCCEYVTKKYGGKTAQKLFYDNPAQILDKR
ncbi:MAG: PHP domain-containing protein [Agathobacter sp.]|nr:PHP domain-containing protein [Agathobacter sp.]